MKAKRIFELRRHEPNKPETDDADYAIAQGKQGLIMISRNIILVGNNVKLRSVLPNVTAMRTEVFR